MAYKEQVVYRKGLVAGFFCDLCFQQIVVAAWIFGRDPRKQKTHYHVDCLIKLADATIAKRSAK